MPLRSSIVAFLVFAAGIVLAAEPFRIPVGAEVTSGVAETGGWAASGVVYAPYVQARARLIAAAAASGWRLSHEIPVGKVNGRTLLAFRRGQDELTLMVARSGVDRSVFSYGLSRAGKKEKAFR